MEQKVFISRYWEHGEEKPVKLFQLTANNEADEKAIEDEFRRRVNNRLSQGHRIEWVFSQWHYAMRNPVEEVGYDLYLTEYDDFTPGINDY